MLVDEAKIKVEAGHGGAGLVAFAKEMMMHAPTGGNGGNGGDVVVEGVSDLNYLRQYRNKKEFVAGVGKAGGQNNRHGADGEEMVLKVPVGTVVNYVSQSSPEDAIMLERDPIEVVEVGQRVVVAVGGKGGRGNAEFKSSKRTSPDYAQPGLPGEAFEIFLDLCLIADVGFIGYPNAGKSSLLNELTPRAGAKVANYEFTTLEPNLGAYFKKGSDWERDKPLILADIPGLIEGASTGKGLGDKFLRHVRRTEVLFHLVSVENEDMAKAYEVIRKELEDYDKELSKKKEYVFVSKTDLVDEKELKARIKELKKVAKVGGAITIYDDASIEPIKKILDTL